MKRHGQKKAVIKNRGSEQRVVVNRRWWRIDRCCGFTTCTEYTALKILMYALYAFEEHSHKIY